MDQQQTLVDRYLVMREHYNRAEREMAESFEGFRELAEAGKFLEAKEYLRPMPDSSSKVLFFREIILMEEDNG